MLKIYNKTMFMAFNLYKIPLFSGNTQHLQQIPSQVARDLLGDLLVAA